MTIIDTDENGQPSTPRVEREEFFSAEVDFLNYKLFKAREKHSYKVTFELDDGVRDFSEEAGNKVYYELLAGLDVFGNDPEVVGSCSTRDQTPEEVTVDELCSL